MLVCMNNDSPFFVFDDQSITSSDFDAMLDRFRSLFTRHRRILIHSDDAVELNLALILSRNLKRELFLCHSFFSADTIRTLSTTHQIDLTLRQGWIDKSGQFIQESDSLVQENGDCLYVFTSGTTGEAKIAQHQWSTIQYSSAYVNERLSARKWMMTYSPTSYAGLQVFFSAFNSGGTIYYAPSNIELMARGMVDHRVEIVSGTPTFWRMLISAWPANLSPVRLEQVTLGGEIVDQDILDSIESFFRPNSMTHIYASTEAGTAVVVSDGIAGFPVKYLDRKRGVRLRIVDGLLQVKTPASMTRYVGGQSMVTDDGWLMTGDAVEIRQDRVYFKGRQDGMINVGGLKVMPEEVETALQAIDGIVDCRVFSKPSPILGSMVAAEVVLGDGLTLNPQFLKNELRKALAEYKIPLVFAPVPQIEATPHGKKSRR